MGTVAVTMRDRPEPELWCMWCSVFDGKTGTKVYHSGAPCPYVKELEWFENGKLKRVIFKDDPGIEYEDETFGDDELP